MIENGKAVGPTGVVSEMMKAAGGFGSRWMTELINNKDVFLMTGERVSWYMSSSYCVIKLSSSIALCMLELHR